MLIARLPNPAESVTSELVNRSEAHLRDFLLRPICEVGMGGDGMTLAGGPVTFHRIETLSMNREARRLPLKSVAPEALARFSAPRGAIAGVAMDGPRIMGVLNVTPDSFSDGRPGESVEEAAKRGVALAEAGADIIDIGGESTRPGAEPVSPAEEQDRVLPVIERLLAAGLSAPISIDTRNAGTARAAIAAGARLWNDVSALTHDPASLETAATLDCPVVLMHAQGEPKTMQDAPTYRHALIEVFAWLESRLAACVAAGIAEERVIVDPGIGFGKTGAHNLQLLSGLAAFHGLGRPVMIGASRKRFIGDITGRREAAARAAGSTGAALAAAAQGAQILRVHDVAETRAALSVWRAASGG